MPFFEFDEGRLVPAQLGRPVADDIDPDLLRAVRAQVLELVQLPLFPVSWHDVPPGGGHAAPRLTAMDASGQVVTVEVVERLDPAALVTALARSARNSELDWTTLGELYPRGTGAFRRDWNAFRESMPPRPAPGPRLIVVAGAVDPAVRPALEGLTGAGVAVHEISVRQTSSGRQLLEISELRPHRVPTGTVLMGRTVERSELPAGPAGEGGEPAGTGDAVVDEAGRPEPAPAGDDADDVEDTVPVGAAGPSDGVVGDDAADLALIARALGGDTPLTWVQLRRGVRHDAMLTADGLVRLADGAAFDDPDLAAAAVSGREGVDGWHVWRFGEAGPTLDEARHELVSAGGRSAGHGRRQA